MPRSGESGALIGRTERPGGLDWEIRDNAGENVEDVKSDNISQSRARKKRQRGGVGRWSVGSTPGPVVVETCVYMLAGLVCG